MIVRNVNYIADTKLKRGVDIIQFDPQMKFVCVYLPSHFTIYLIDMIEFSYQLQVSMLHFAQTKLYSSKLAVETLTKIDTSKDHCKSGVTLIKIASKWQNRQFLAYATMQHIHIYEIYHKDEQITIKPFQTLIVDYETPVIALRFYYSALYLGYHNDDMKIYQIDYKKNLWYQSDSIVKMTDQFLRIAIYDNNSKQDVRESKVKRKINRKSGSVKQESQMSELRKRYSDFQRLLSINQIMTYNEIECQISINKNELQPAAPTIIYQRIDNSLWMAEYDHEERQYVHIELCPPMECVHKVIYDQYIDEYQQEVETEIKRKTPAKSNKKISQKSLKKTPNQKSQIKTQIKEDKIIKTSIKRKSSVKKIVQNEYFDEDYQQQEIIQPTEDMYKLTMCQNYIIYDTQISYKILSRGADWNEIYEDKRLPIVNSFYEKIQSRVFMEILHRMGDEFCDELMVYLSENFEFLMAAFFQEIPYGNDLQKIDLLVLKVELLVVDKIGGKEEQQQKGLRLDIIKGILQMQKFLDKDTIEINEVYDEDLVKEIKQRMQGMKLNVNKGRKKMKSQSKSKTKKSSTFGTNIKKKVRIDENISNNEQKMRTRQKTPSSKKYNEQKQQKLEQNTNIGGYNLRMRSSKQKSPYIQKEHESFKKGKKSQNQKKNSHQMKYQQHNEGQQEHQQYQQQQYYKQKPQTIQAQQQTVNEFPHTYRFPICQFEYIKHYPKYIEWISENEMIIVDKQRRLDYFTIHPNIIYSVVAKIYLYLYWIQFRDDLNPMVVRSFSRVIESFLQEEKEVMQRQFEDERDYECEQNRSDSHQMKRQQQSYQQYQNNNTSWYKNNSNNEDIEI